MQKKVDEKKKKNEEKMFKEVENEEENKNLNMVNRFSNPYE